LTSQNYHQLLQGLKKLWKFKKLKLTSGYAMWFMAWGAIRIALRQLWQTWKLRHYDIIDDVITL